MSTAAAGMRGQPPKVTITPPTAPDPIKEIKSDPPTIEIKEGEEVELTENQVRAIMANSPTSEELKYNKCWDLPAYRNYAPGEHLVDMFLEAVGEVEEGTTIIDYGCGTGRASKKLYEAGFDVTMLDFADNCLDDDIRELSVDNPRLRFVKHDLTKKCDFESDYGFCTDMMEHVPTEDVNTVLSNILLASKFVFFQISTQHDGFGSHPNIDDDLHLTVENYFEWLARFLNQSVVVIRSEDRPNSVIFYVTGWSQYQFRSSDAKVNIPQEESHAHIIENAKLGLKNVRPHQPQDTEVVLVCGGQSLLNFKDDIIAKRESGMPLITINGSYGLMMDWGLKPSMLCMIDGREFNKRFAYQVEGMTDDCVYMISTHCHPRVFDNLPLDRTYAWHVSLDREGVEVTKEHYGEMYEDWFPCPGGSTAALRTLCLLRMLGFNKIHVYGMDSCNFDEKGHHAYEQKENDGRRQFPMTVARGTKWEKEFQCEDWHVYQAREFIQMIPRVLHDCDLAVYGDGAIAYMLNTAAAQAEDGEPLTLDLS
jgi:SAM-dependent methyltransferase